MAVNFFKKGDAAMINKKIINPNRVRHIEGGFGFIPHRFLTDGFIRLMNQKELLLYFFLIMASDRYGLSFYSYDAICSCLELCLEDYIVARDGLIKEDLIAFDGTLFQVLSLPERPVRKSAPVREEGRFRITSLVRQSLLGAYDGR
jgi:hypothetical protein